jgi:aryl-alcohol dehydrogenase-like predicted oxidoreductase
MATHSNGMSALQFASQLGITYKTAWLLAQKPWLVPIPGTTKLQRMEENNGGAAVQLTPAELDEIGNAAAKITVQGARYPEQMQRLVGR